MIILDPDEIIFRRGGGGNIRELFINPAVHLPVIPVEDGPAQQVMKKRPEGFIGKPVVIVIHFIGIQADRNNLIADIFLGIFKDLLKGASSEVPGQPIQVPPLSLRTGPRAETRPPLPGSIFQFPVSFSSTIGSRFDTMHKLPLIIDLLSYDVIHFT